MDSYHKSKCHKIIHTAAASASAIALGLAQIPGSDTIPITAIQVGMIIELGSVFGMDISEAAAKSILGAGLAAIGGRTVSQFLVGWIPGWGNAVNATTAFTITETLGWKVANDFSEEAEKQAEAERLEREEAEKKANAERLAQEEAERKAQKESEKQAQSHTEKTAEQSAQTTLQKQDSIPAKAKENLYKRHISMCVVFSLVLFAACMCADLLLEKFTMHFRVWCAVSGIILAVLVNAVIFIICKNKGWSSKSSAVMAYSNYLAVVIDVVCALVTSSGKDVSGWDEAIVAFFTTPLLNWGLVIIAVLWWFKVDRRILADWE